MKLKSKLLLASTCLLTMSVAASATSAYAWIVANRQAFVSIADVGVSTNATALKVEAVKPDAEQGDSIDSTNTGKAGDRSKDPLALSSEAAITDLSGDGTKLFKPTFYADNEVTNVQSIDQKVNNTPAGSIYYHQFRLKFTQTNATATTAVLLNPTSSLALKTGEHNGHKPYRIAILNKAGTELLWYYAPNRTSAEVNDDLMIVAEATDEGTALNLTEDNTYMNLVNTLSTKVLGSDNFKTPTTYEEDFSGQQGYVGTITGSAAVEITVRVWLEGQDPLCTSTMATDTVDLALKFDGYDAVAKA